jgi:hypothetical protein
MARTLPTFTTGPECRAKAASLRTMSDHAHTPGARERMLDMALEWDARADAYDASAQRLVVK